MRHIVFCWELGGGMGHLVPLSLLAAEMVARGHRVSFITSDVAHAAQYLDGLGVTWYQAPRLRLGARQSQMFNHADILLTTGYDTVEHLHGLLGAWRGLFDLLRPDRIVCEYAPTAQLAAYSLGMPVVCIDNGFSVPPISDPMPPLRDDQPVAPEVLKASENKVLSVINGVMERIKARKLPRFSCLYEDETWYRNWPEFNHFGPHSVERHLGQIFGVTDGVRPIWPKGVGPKLFAYVKNDNPVAVPMLHAAVSLGFRILAYLPGQQGSVVDTLTGTGRVFVSARPVKLSALDEDIEIGVWQSPTGGVGHSLEKGMRMLFLPTQAEQYRACRAVERAGVPAKIVIGMQDWRAVFETLLAMPRMHLGNKWTPANLPRMASILGGY